MLHWLEKPNWDAWAQLPAFIAGEGPSPFKAAHGMSNFEFMERYPESAKPFNEMQTMISLKEMEVCTEDYDWSPFQGKTVVDVGGNHGPVMVALRKKQPSIRAIVFELPDVVASVGDVPEGVEFVAGDFFDSSTIPKTDGAIFMKHVLHNWSDEDAIKILQSCHAALLPGGKVVIADAVLPNPGETSSTHLIAKHIDMFMSLIDGKERTRAEWENLAKKTSFVVEGVLMTDSPGCQVLTLARVEPLALDVKAKNNCKSVIPGVVMINACQKKATEAGKREIFDKVVTVKAKPTMVHGPYQAGRCSLRVERCPFQPTTATKLVKTIVEAFPAKALKDEEDGEDEDEDIESSSPSSGGP
jgi:SAM-dependent methyltransferase